MAACSCIDLCVWHVKTPAVFKGSNKKMHLYIYTYIQMFITRCFHVHAFPICQRNPNIVSNSNTIAKELVPASVHASAAASGENVGTDTIQGGDVAAYNPAVAVDLSKIPDMLRGVPPEFSNVRSSWQVYLEHILEELPEQDGGFSAMATKSAPLLYLNIKEDVAQCCWDTAMLEASAFIMFALANPSSTTTQAWDSLNDDEKAAFVPSVDDVLPILHALPPQWRPALDMIGYRKSATDPSVPLAVLRPIKEELEDHPLDNCGLVKVEVLRPIKEELEDHPLDIAADVSSGSSGIAADVLGTLTSLDREFHGKSTLRFPSVPVSWMTDENQDSLACVHTMLTFSLHVQIYMHTHLISESFTMTCMICTYLYIY